MWKEVKLEETQGTEDNWDEPGTAGTGGTEETEGVVEEGIVDKGMIGEFVEGRELDKQDKESIYVKRETWMAHEQT